MNSSDPRPTQDLYSHGFTVPQSDPHRFENDPGLQPDKKHGMIHSIKEGLRDVVNVIKGDREPQRADDRSAEQILEDIKPHFVKTLTPNDNDIGEGLHRDLRSTETQDVRIIQTGGEMGNLFQPKNIQPISGGLH